MKEINFIFCTLIFALLSACGTVPQSRGHYIQLLQDLEGWGSDQKLITKTVTNNSFDTVVANIDDKLQGCIPGGYVESTMRGSSISSNTVKNNKRIIKVNPDKAEVTIQQQHSNMLMQSEGGLYLLAADVMRRSTNSTQINFYTTKNYRNVMDAIRKWAEGSQQCHGIGGNP